MGKFNQWVPEYTKLPDSRGVVVGREKYFQGEGGETISLIPPRMSRTSAWSGGFYIRGSHLYLLWKDNLGWIYREKIHTRSFRPIWPPEKLEYEDYWLDRKNWYGDY